MILLDAFALIAFLRGEASAPLVRGLLRSGGCWLGAVQLAETLDVSVRVLGHDRGAVERALDPLLATTLGLLDVGEPEAREAARMRAAHYRKGDSELSLADCLLIAAALHRSCVIATSDGPLARAARLEAVGVSALPNSAGHLP